MERRGLAHELFAPYEQVLGRGEDLLLSVPWCAGLVASVGFGAQIKHVALLDKCRGIDATFAEEELRAFMDRFERYEAHDADYLRAFSACLSVLFSVTPSHLGDAVSMLFEAINSTQKEYLAVLANTQSMMESNKTQGGFEKSKSFDDYIAYISRMASVALEHNNHVHRPGINICTFSLAVSLLPCYQLYAYIGKHIRDLLIQLSGTTTQLPPKRRAKMTVRKEWALGLSGQRSLISFTPYRRRNLWLVPRLKHSVSMSINKILESSTNL